MALTSSDDVIIPTSSGAITTPTDPVVLEQGADASSSGAVKFDASPVTAEFGPVGPESTGTVETPGPVTVTGPYAKVVRTGRRAAPQTSTAETDEPTAEQPASQPSPPSDGR